MHGLDKVFDLLDRLQESNIHFMLAYHTPRALMILVTVPGERWEIEVSSDEEFQVEVFTSSGGVRTQPNVDELFDRFAD